MVYLGLGGDRGRCGEEREQEKRGGLKDILRDSRRMGNLYPVGAKWSVS